MIEILTAGNVAHLYKAQLLTMVGQVGARSTVALQGSEHTGPMAFTDQDGMASLAAITGSH